MSWLYLNPRLIKDNNGEEVTWVDVLGLYLLVGTISACVGWTARLRWEASGKIEPIPTKFRRRVIFFGTALGIILWPVAIAVLMVGWRVSRRTKKMARFVGYCEHGTVAEPYCAACKCALEREEAMPTGDKTHE